MIKIHARQKRLATRKKNDIMRKEQNDLTAVKESRKRSQKLVDYRYRNRVQSMINSEQYNKSLDEWARNDFKTNQLAKPDLEMVNQLIDKKEKMIKEFKDKDFIHSARGRSTSI